MNELALPTISAAQIQGWGALDQGGSLCAPKRNLKLGALGPKSTQDWESSARLEEREGSARFEQPHKTLSS